MGDPILPLYLASNACGIFNSSPVSKGCSFHSLSDTMNQG